MNDYRNASITRITAIINGTTNYVLTRMREGMSSEKALAFAQEKGFAEADPTLDMDGTDAAQKIAVLASIAFGRWFKPSEVYREGIKNITPIDIEYAKKIEEAEYVIKLIATAGKTEKGEIDIRVHPALVPINHNLAAVNDEYNAIYIQASPLDDLLLVGKGAGEGPTAFSVYNDIKRVAEMVRSGTVKNINFQGNDVGVADQNIIETEGYLRLYLHDVSGHRPVSGSLSAVADVFKRHGLSVEHSIQKKGKHDRRLGEDIYVSHIVTHHPLAFGKVREVLADLSKIGGTKGKPLYESPFHLRIYRDL